jgi:hypothetical protein
MVLDTVMFGAALTPPALTGFMQAHRLVDVVLLRRNGYVVQAPKDLAKSNRLWRTSCRFARSKKQKGCVGTSAEEICRQPRCCTLVTFVKGVPNVCEQSNVFPCATQKSVSDVV